MAVKRSAASICKMNTMFCSSNHVILVSICRLSVQIVAIRPSLDFHQIIWISAGHANMNKSGAQDRRMLLLNLAGTACKAKHSCRHNLVITVASSIRVSAIVHRRTSSHDVLNI